MGHWVIPKITSGLLAATLIVGTSQRAASQMPEAFGQIFQEVLRPAAQDALRKGGSAGQPSSGASSLRLSGNNRWLVFASRRTANEALDLAREFLNRFPNVSVMQSSNGWYAVVSGPMNVPDPRLAKEALLRSGGVPTDVGFSTGENWVAQISLPVQNSASAPKPAPSRSEPLNAKAAEERTSFDTEAKRTADARAAEGRARADAEAKQIADAKAIQEWGRAAGDLQRVAKARSAEERIIAEVEPKGLTAERMPIDNLFSDGLWQREFEGATSGGVCSAKGAVSLYENGIEQACGTQNVGCEKTSNVSIQKTGENSFYLTVRVLGGNRVLYRQKAVRSPDKLKVMLEKIEDFDGRGRSNSAEAELNETQQSPFHKCQNMSFAEWRAEQVSATARRQSRDAEKKLQYLERERQELARLQSPPTQDDLRRLGFEHQGLGLRGASECVQAVEQRYTGRVTDKYDESRSIWKVARVMVLNDGERVGLGYSLYGGRRWLLMGVQIGDLNRYGITNTRDLGEMHCVFSSENNVMAIERPRS